MKKAIALLCCCVALLAQSAEPISIKNGFGTGEEFLRMPRQEKRVYLQGLTTGMLAAPLFGAPKSKMLRMEQCITGMTDTQLVAILEKYLNENPATWQMGPHILMFNALNSTCQK
jgi:hypothetical protein